jgi:hypothetical protein
MADLFLFIAMLIYIDQNSTIFFHIDQNGASNLALQFLAGALSDQYQGIKKELKTRRLIRSIFFS